MAIAHPMIRFNEQPQRQGKMCEHFATRPTGHSRSVFVGTPVVCIPIEDFQTLANEANIAYDHFIRTSDPDHRFAVQHFWVRTITEDRRARADNVEAHAQRPRLDLFQET